MQNRSTFALLVVFVSIVLGIAGSLLLRGAAWGLNLPLWVLLTTACAFGLLRKSDVTISRAAKWMALPILGFSLCFFWRDSDSLKVANGFVLAIAIGVLAQRCQIGRPSSASVRDYSLNLIKAWLWFTVDFAELVAKDIDWRKNSPSTVRLASVIRGILLALPVLLIFGGLFASADAVFNSSLIRAFAFDPVDATASFFAAVLLAVMAGGIIRRLCWPEKPSAPRQDRHWGEKPWLGGTEIVVAFGLLDALFALFVIVQMRYLFGGGGQVAQVAGLTYAKYARHGFFELVCAAALTVPVILGAQELLPAGEPRVRGWFVGLSGTLVVSVFVVLASALFRMHLYVDAYGLSQLRLYTALFIAWLAITFVWLLVTIVTAKRSRFAFGALVAGYVVVLGANYINPDALIARTNLDAARSPDLTYLGELSVDAAPAITERVKRLPADQGRQLKDAVRNRWRNELTRSDWRSLNLSRMKYEAFYRRKLRD
jgi:hypothetical protein